MLTRDRLSYFMSFNLQVHVKTRKCQDLFLELSEKIGKSRFHVSSRNLLMFSCHINLGPFATSIKKIEK
jgi:hypothetical protein